MKPNSIKASELTKILLGLIEEGYDTFPDYNVQFETFEDAGVLTNDHGIVLRVGHNEFQITIIKSR